MSSLNPNGNLPTFPGPKAANALIIYHAHCMDGFGAAWSAYKNRVERYYSNYEYVAMDYKDPLPAHIPELPPSDTEIFILDFSFPPAKFTELCNSYVHVTMLDHHESAADSFRGYVAPANSTVYFSPPKEHSGAYLAWKFFCDPGWTGDVPELIAYIEDRDLWKWHLRFSSEINELIAFTPKLFEYYDRLDNRFQANDFDAMVSEGKLIQSVNSKHIDSILAAGTRPFNLRGAKGLICNCPGQFASTAGNMLAKQSGTFGATYFAHADGSHKFSLRSIGDYDVAKLAKEFGGGGHKNAAGFTLADPIDSGAEGVVIWGIDHDEFPDDYEV